MYVHVIRMYDTTPFIRRSYPIPYSIRPEVDKIIQNMLSLGVIKQELTSYVSPLAVARKKYGSVRVCLNARLLNERMLDDHDSPAPPEEIFNLLQDVDFISTIASSSSYWQISLSCESTQYTGFLYNNNTYTFQVLPFGLKTAIGSFSRGMGVILGPQVNAYIDHFIFSKDFSSFETSGTSL